jgi:hypothetical protein
MKSANFGYFRALCPVGMPPISSCVIAYLNIQYSPISAGMSKCQVGMSCGAANGFDDMAN